MLRLTAVLLASLAPASAVTSLHYQFAARLDGDRPKLHVTLQLRSSGTTELALPSTWGSGTKLQGAITNLKVESGGASLEDTADQSKKLLRGKGRIRLSWDVANDWEGPLRESVRHRAHIAREYVEINTQNALIFPNLDVAAPVDCTFEWDLPPAWKLATSFGTRHRQRFRGSWDAVENTLFIAGDFRLHRATSGTGELLIAIRGSWKTPDNELVANTAKVFRMEQDLWKDHDFPYYLVTFVPFGSGQSGTGGGGFTNALAMHTAPENSGSAELMSVLIHEIFHTWNPYRIGRMRSPADRIYWFTEGFTAYYQHALMWRAGLQTFPEYVRELNGVIRDYHFSPSRDLSVQSIIDRANATGYKDRISYDRGAAIALWLDRTIRNAKGSKASLDTLMFDLYREARNRRSALPDLTPERIYAAARRYVSEDEVSRLKSYAELGATVDAPADAFGTCATREVVSMPEFDFGMNREAFAEKHVIAQLRPDSAAAKAGLQDGDKVVGMSVYWNDTAKPVKITVQRNGKPVRFEYLPIGPAARPVPQYVPQTSTCALWRAP